MPAAASASPTQYQLGSSQNPYVACVEARASGESSVVDDFEEAGVVLAERDGRAGFWYAYDDGSGGRLSFVEETDAAAANHVLHANVAGFTTWGATVALALAIQRASGKSCWYDASRYSGLRFRARGTGTVRVMIATVGNTPTLEGGTCERPGDACYDWPGSALTVTDDWRDFELPFCMLTPQGFGGQVAPLEPGEIVGVHFRVPPGQDTEFWLDDLAFYGEEPEGATCAAKCPMDLVPATARIDPSFTTRPLDDEWTLHTFAQDTPSCGAIERRYLAYVPRELPETADAPVFFLLHGLGANAESVVDTQTRGRLAQLAKQDGFIVVYGNAAPGAATDPDPLFPNSGPWRQATYDDGLVDDVDYIERVIGDLSERGVTAGGNAIYLVGHSNGGGMALEAAKRRPDAFTGLATFMAYDGTEPTPVPDISATRLERVMFVYTRGDPGMPAGYHEILGGLPLAWAGALGMSEAAIANPSSVEVPDVAAEGENYAGTAVAALTTRNSRAVRHDRVEGTRKLSVFELDHAGHFLPHPDGETNTWIIERWGFRNQDFSASDAIWEFFRETP